MESQLTKVKATKIMESKIMVGNQYATNDKKKESKGEKPVRTSQVQTEQET